jgi:hypothetical protein
MLFNPKHESHLRGLKDEPQFSPSLAFDLISAVVADARAAHPARGNAARAARLDQLIQARAWSDAALVLIELELPAWKLRRLVYEDGEWLCSLSTQPNLPAEFDDTADASHEVLPLAILNALFEARRRTDQAHETNPPTVPQVRPASGYAVCCDNFA